MDGGGGGRKRVAATSVRTYFRIPYVFGSSNKITIVSLPLWYRDRKITRTVDLERVLARTLDDRNKTLRLRKNFFFFY